MVLVVGTWKWCSTSPRRLFAAGGSACARGHGTFRDHCLVMRDDRVLFDPAAAHEVPRGMRLRLYERMDVTAGIRFGQYQQQDVM